MKIKLIIAIFILAFVQNTYAQSYDLGKVTVEELAEKNTQKTLQLLLFFVQQRQNLFSFSQQDGFKVITEVEVKIKVYKKEGYKWAEKEVDFQASGIDDEAVNFSKAVTYNLVNGKLKNLN